MNTDIAPTTNPFAGLCKEDALRLLTEKMAVLTRQHEPAILADYRADKITCDQAAEAILNYQRPLLALYFGS